MISRQDTLMTTRTDRFYLLSLGCSKNTVDSESIAQVLNQQGMRGVGDPASAELLIVNTCGFIGSAREESISALRDLVGLKREDQLVLDCLVRFNIQAYRGAE